jgi:hypothetical protein
MNEWMEALTKVLPVEQIYKDLAQPSVRQVGQAAESVVKVARFVIAPVEYVAAQHSRWQRYLERIANKVPEDRRVEAHAQLAGPVLDSLRYVQEDGLIAEMFVNLLARAVDKERVHEAHPAFTHIINQLSPDEGLILFHLKKQTYAYHQHAKYNSRSNTFSDRTLMENGFPIQKLIFPQNFELYMDHLHHLDLAGIWQDGNQEAIYEGEPPLQTGVNIKSRIHLQSFGVLLAKACVPDEMPVRDGSREE